MPVTATKLSSRGLATLLLALSAASCASPRGPTPETNGTATMQAGDRPGQGATGGSGALESVAEVVEKVIPSVVSVSAEKVVRTEEHPLFNDPFFRRFFGPGGPEQERRQQGLGSGVVMPNGYVLTNNHVVEGASEIKVMAARREFDAEIVGTDAKSDVAVLRVKNPKGLVPIRVGDSSKLRLGDAVMAIGSPFGLGETVTKGIVSAKGRANLGIVEYEDFIQTDAAINPGNSGGALVNARGELVGINTAILSRGGGSVGIGFAIPSNMVMPIMESLITKGRVIRGYLGALLQEVDRDLAEAMKLPVASGVLIADVVPGGPAEKAGLKRGDVVTEFNGQPVAETGQFRNLVANSPAKSKVRLTVLRQGERRALDVVLAERPNEGTAADERAPGAGKTPELEGLSLEPLSPQARAQLKLPPQMKGGVLVRGVAQGSRAADAGLQSGDVVLEVGGRQVSSPDELVKAIRASQGKVALVVWRDGGTRFLVLGR